MKRVTRIPCLPGLKMLPAKYQVIEINYNTVEVKRPDGLVVFFDRKKEPCSVMLNKIRLALPADTVIRIVGTVRGYQTSITYARKYHKPALAKYRAQLGEFLKCMNDALALGVGAERVLEVRPSLQKIA